MAQQINLYSPILLKPKRLFSAEAIVQAAAVFTVAVAVACAWVSAQVKAFKNESLATERRYLDEQQQLQTALALRPAPNSDVSALQQQLKIMHDMLDKQRKSLQDMNLGRAIDGRTYSAILKLVADTVPPPVWIKDVKMAIGRFEITGMTLEPAALQAWSRLLSAHPLLQGQHLAEVRVERAPWRAPDLPGAPNTAAPREAWAFTLSSNDEIEPPPATRTAKATAGGEGAAALAGLAASGAK